MKRAKAPIKRTSTSARRVRDKFTPEMLEENGQQYVAAMPRFEAKNANQRLALHYLREGRQVVSLQGSPGTGKSMIAAYWAASQLKAKKVDQIILLRPNVLNGSTIGLVPGTESEKLAPFFVQTVEHLKKFLGAGYYQYCAEKGIIITRAFEYIRGQSFERATVVAEEVQGLTFDEFETLMTRIGEGSQIILTGDSRQVNRGFASGMDSTFKMLEEAVKNAPRYLDDEDLDVLEGAVGVVRFTPDDILRSGFVKALTKLYYYKEV